MEEKVQKRRRRSPAQILASKRLRYAQYLGGDGFWCLLTKSRPKWRYRLFEDRLDAEIAMSQVRETSSDYVEMRVFKLLEESGLPPPQPPAPVKEGQRGLFE